MTPAARAKARAEASAAASAAATAAAAAAGTASAAGRGRPRLRVLEGNLGDVPGFRAVGVPAGIKRRKRDLALILSQGPGTTSAGVFTQNKVRAAPVLVSEPRARAGRAKAIIVNSGCANACTGPRGLRDAERMAALAAEVAGCSQEEVLVSSTGIIGEPLPMDKIEAGMAELAKALDGPNFGATEAIMTTDTVEKQVLVEFTVQGRTCRLGGIAKGSGMIHPNMATMLGFLGTDAAVEAGALQQALGAAVDRTFNMITVDGDSSTNDMVLLLASGVAGNPPLRPGVEGWEAFVAALEAAAEDLAKQIARDGEGAERLIEVQVKGALSVEEARLAAKTVAGSNLVKAAMFGRDPNWGRIVAALGRSGAEVRTEHLDVTLANGVGRVKVFGKGKPAKVKDQALLFRVLASGYVKIQADLGLGAAEAKAWGCDLTYDYVRINAEYTT